MAPARMNMPIIRRDRSSCGKVVLRHLCLGCSICAGELPDSIFLRRHGTIQDSVAAAVSIE